MHFSHMGPPEGPQIGVWSPGLGPHFRAKSLAMPPCLAYVTMALGQPQGPFPGASWEGYSQGRHGEIGLFPGPYGPGPGLPGPSLMGHPMGWAGWACRGLYGIAHQLIRRLMG
jgi:hypothetical protein